MNLIKNRILICIVILIWIIPGIKGQDKSSFRPFFCIQVTDIQFGMFEADKGFTKETVLYEKAVEAINKLMPDFVVMTGDFVNNKEDRSQFNEFKRITAMIRKDIPVFLIPGNHDIGVPVEKKGTDRFIEDWGYDRFSFVKNNCLFIGINSCIIKSGESSMEKEQFEWMKKVLEDGKGSVQKVVFTHYPFFIKSIDEPDTYSNIASELRKKYFSLFDENQVGAVFAGHLHNNGAARYKNTEMITTSAAGRSLGKEASGIRVIKITADHIESIYYPLDSIPGRIILSQQ
jgi:serine/threonine-protein phosphatase CPPED1